MLQALFPYLNWTQLFVLVTFVLGCGWLPRTNRNLVVLLILSVCFLTEVLSLVLVALSVNNGLLFSISILIHNSLWLFLLYAKKSHWVLIAYVVIALVNILFFEGVKNFNYSSFILSAFIYLFGYLWMSFQYLKTESFSFFNSSAFVLLSAPVLFFLGLSSVLAFRSGEISRAPVLGSINLYSFVGFFVNLLYYALMCTYIIKERRNAHH